MGTKAPTAVTIPVPCAPKKAPCPQCGKHGRRKRTLPPRLVRTVAYKAIVDLEITCGEYQAPCGCCTTFRGTPEGVLPRALYDNKVRDLVLDRILEDGMSIERISLVRFVVLRLDRLWSRWTPPQERKPRSPQILPEAGRQAATGKKPPKVA